MHLHRNRMGGCGVNLAQDRDKWQTALNAVKNLGVL